MYSFVKPAGIKVEEAALAPLTRRGKQNGEQQGAVDARPVQQVRAEKEEKDEAGRGECRDKEERKPAGMQIICQSS